MVKRRDLNLHIPIQTVSIESVALTLKLSINSTLFILDFIDLFYSYLILTNYLINQFAHHIISTLPKYLKRFLLEYFLPNSSHI